MHPEQRAERTHTDNGRLPLRVALLAVGTLALGIGLSGCGTAQPNSCRTEAVVDEKNPDHVIGFHAAIFGQHDPNQTYVAAEDRSGKRSGFVKSTEATINIGSLDFTVSSGQDVMTMIVKQGEDGSELPCAPVIFTNVIPQGATT